MIKNRLPAALLLLLAASGLAQDKRQGSRILAPPRAGFSCEIPHEWLRGPDAMRDMYVLLAQGRALGYRPAISIEIHHAGNSAAYRYAAQKLGKRTAQSTQIGSLKAWRFQTSETHRLKTLDVPRRNAVNPTATTVVKRDYVVIPDRERFWVVTLAAPEDRFEHAQAGLSRVLETLVFHP